VAQRFKGTQPGIRRGSLTERPRSARNKMFQGLRAKESRNTVKSQNPFGAAVKLAKKRTKKDRDDE